MKPLLLLSSLFFILGQFGFLGAEGKRVRSGTDEVRVYTNKKQRNSQKCNKTLCNQGRSSLKFDKRCIKAQFCMRGVVKDAKKLKKEKEECLKKHRDIPDIDIVRKTDVNNENLQIKYEELKKNYNSIITNQQTLELSLGILKAENLQYKLIKTKLTQENEALKLIQMNMTEENKDLKLMQEKIQEENEALKMGQISLTEENRELKQIQRKIQEENKQVKRTNQNLMEEAEKLNLTGQALTVVETKLDNCFKSKLELREECSAQNYQCSETLKSTSLDLNQTKADLNEQQKQYEIISNKNKELRNEHNQMMTENQGMKSESSEHEEMKEENQRMKSELIEHKQMKEENQRMKSELIEHKQMKEENKKIKSEINELTKKHTQIVSNFGITKLQLSMCVEEKQNEMNLTLSQLTACQTESFRLLQKTDQLTQNNTLCLDSMEELDLCKEETARLAILVENKLSKAKARREELDSFVNQNTLNITTEVNEETNQESVLYEEYEHEADTEIDISNQLEECQQEVIDKDLALKKERTKICLEEEIYPQEEVTESEMLSLEMKNKMLTYQISNLTMSLSECNEEMAAMLVIPAVKEEVSDFLVHDLLN